MAQGLILKQASTTDNFSDDGKFAIKMLLLDFKNKQLA